MKSATTTLPVLLTAVLPVFLTCAGLERGRGDLPPGGEEVLLMPARKMQEVRVRLPKDHDAGRSYPLLLMLHGNGGRAAGLSSMLAPYSGRPVILAFPEGLYPRALPSGLGFSWYYATRDKSVWETADSLNVENILELIEALSQRYRAGRAYVFGFSEGASLAYTAGLRNPSLIRGIAAVGGTLPEIGGQGSLLTPQHIERAKTLRIFIARGRGDKLMKKESFEDQRDFFQSRGYDVAALEYIGGHVLTPGLLDRLFSWIQEVDCRWIGGLGSGPWILF